MPKLSDWVGIFPQNQPESFCTSIHHEDKDLSDGWTVSVVRMDSSQTEVPITFSFHQRQISFTLIRLLCLAEFRLLSNKMVESMQNTNMKLRNRGSWSSSFVSSLSLSLCLSNLPDFLSHAAVRLKSTHSFLERLELQRSHWNAAESSGRTWADMERLAGSLPDSYSWFVL